MKSKLSKQSLIRPAVILIWLLIWELAARITDNAIILAGPIDTLSLFFSFLADTAFWSAVLSSLARILAGFFMSAACALLLGTAAFFQPCLKAFLSPIVALMKAVPVASFVILALIWLGGSSELSLLVSFVVVFPMIWASVLGGLEAADSKLLELSRVFELGLVKRLRYIYIPELLPYLSASLSSAIGMAWRSGVAAELIGQPKDTIGFYLYQSKIFLDTPGLFAWTLAVILLSWISEKLIKAVLKLWMD